MNKFLKYFGFNRKSDLKIITLKSGFDVTYISTNELENEVFLNDEKFFNTILQKDKNGFLNIENFYIETFEDIIKLNNYLFETDVELIQSESNKYILDISQFKNKCIDFEKLENTYLDWIETSKRENTMDEYGMLLGIIGYIQRNNDKKYLLIRIEKQ